jgi:hypothetical protein
MLPLLTAMSGSTNVFAGPLSCSVRHEGSFGMDRAHRRGRHRTKFQHLHVDMWLEFERVALLNPIGVGLDGKWIPDSKRQ